MSVIQKLKDWLIGDVSPELAACEFGCRDKTCDEARWETCPNRLRHADAERVSEKGGSSRSSADEL